MHIKIFGKSIIAGEHSVIRGNAAIVFPVKARFLELNFEKSENEFEANFEGDTKDDLSLVFWGTLEKALKILNRKHSELRGMLNMTNTVPVGAGMGASAALCTAIGRFLQNLGWVNEAELYEFCRQLENLFHGESSGVDIAATLKGEPIEFQRPSKISLVKMNWRPNLFLSHSGQRGMTAECVGIVKELWKKNESEAKKIDFDMNESVELAKKSFENSSNDGLVDLIKSINKAKSCFERWGLTAGVLDEHMKKILEAGALAVKPTGSGRGGYVLSLWKDAPSAQLQTELSLIKI